MAAICAVCPTLSASAILPRVSNAGCWRTMTRLKGLSGKVLLFSPRDVWPVWNPCSLREGAAPSPRTHAKHQIRGCHPSAPISCESRLRGNRRCSALRCRSRLALGALQLGSQARGTEARKPRRRDHSPYTTPRSLPVPTWLSKITPHMRPTAAMASLRAVYAEDAVTKVIVQPEPASHSCK
jgi:hypothetical protein